MSTSGAMEQTGPKSQRGKAVSSRNAQTHGLLCNTPVLDIENPAEWDEHLQGVLESLAPEGYLETAIAHRVATLLWRIARVVRYETEMVSIGLDYDPDHEAYEILRGKIINRKTGEIQMPDRDRRLHIAARLIPGEMTGPMIMRYEAHLHREWLQSQHELESMQVRRQGGTSVLTRVDITGPPGV
jgi:hypothetical protein